MFRWTSLVHLPLEPPPLRGHGSLEGPPGPAPGSVPGTAVGRRAPAGGVGQKAHLQRQLRPPHAFPRVRLCGAPGTGPPTRLPRARACERACPRQTGASWGFVPPMEQEDRNVSLENTFQYRFWEERRWITTQGCWQDGVWPRPPNAPSASPTPLPSLNPKPRVCFQGGGRLLG